MTGSISEQLVTNSNHAAQAQANQKSATASTNSNSTVSSQQFLHLLTEQLKYQDPMNPMDNSEMLAQEAQFATLEQMEALASNFSQFSTMYQANSLLGQNVEVTVDGDTKSGKVDYVDYSDKSGASISVGGQLYPIGSITKVYPQDAGAQITEDEKNFFVAAANSIASNLGSITQKIFGYEDNSGSTDSNTNTENNTETNN